MVVREMIATARERIAKLREAKRMVGARGGAQRQRERGASRTHLKEAAGTVSVGFATWLHLGVRFAPFMVRFCIWALDSLLLW